VVGVSVSSDAATGATIARREAKEVRAMNEILGVISSRLMKGST